MSERKCVKDAHNNPLWLKVMHEELRSFKHNNTWASAPPDSRHENSRQQQVYRTKLI